MDIRPAVPDDAHKIAAINAAAWKTAFSGVVASSYLDNYDGVPGTRRNDLTNSGPDAVQLVAVEDGDVVGWLAGQPTQEDDCDPTSTFEIRACYVRPDRWRSGIGRKLIAALIDRLDLGRWRELTVWTPRDTPQSHRFYESCGFRRDGAESELDKNGPVAIIRFRLRTTRDSTSSER